MGRTYQQFCDELMGWIPKIDPDLARLIVQRAWRDIRDQWHWSFLQAKGILYSPAVITAGTVNVVQYSPNFTMDATAIAAIAATGLSNPIITKRQIRLGQQWLSIAAYDDITGIGAFDDLYYGATNATSGYQIYRCYYGPPLNALGAEVTDFAGYRSVFNPTSSEFFWPLHGSQEALNSSDPHRIRTGAAFSLYSYRTDANNQPLFEMYPHPTSALFYPVVYQRRGEDLALTEQLPPTIPDLLLMEYCLMEGCKWAAMNSSRWPELANINWRLLGNDHEKDCARLMADAKRQDEEVFLQSIIVDYNRAPRGVDEALWPGYFSITP